MQTTGLIDVSLSSLSQEKTGPDTMAACLEYIKTAAANGVDSVDAGSMSDPFRYELAHQAAAYFPSYSIVVHVPLGRRAIFHAHEAIKACRRGRIALHLPAITDLNTSNRFSSIGQLITCVEDCVRYASNLDHRPELFWQVDHHLDPIFVARLSQHFAKEGAGHVSLAVDLTTLRQLPTWLRRIERSMSVFTISLRTQHKPNQGTEEIRLLVESTITELAVAVGSIPGEDYAIPLSALPKIVPHQLTSTQIDRLHTAYALVQSTLPTGITQAAMSRMHS